MVGWPYVLQQFYELFLLEFPPQPNDPHRLVVKPLSLQCYPRYSRFNDISLVYSSSLSETASHVNQGESLYTTFMVYFMDYRPPNILNSKNIFLKWRSDWPYRSGISTLSFICFTKVRKFWETIKLFWNFFFDWWFWRIHSSLIVPSPILLTPYS